jgi:hypothetical protein
VNPQADSEGTMTMTDIYRPINDGPDSHSSSHQSNNLPPESTGKEASRTLLAGVVGGVVSAAGYLIYSRLPEDQKDKLHQQVRTLVETRLNELRSRFNV